MCVAGRAYRPGPGPGCHRQGRPTVPGLARRIPASSPCSAGRRADRIVVSRLRYDADGAVIGRRAPADPVESPARSGSATSGGPRRPRSPSWTRCRRSRRRCASSTWTGRLGPGRSRRSRSTVTSGTGHVVRRQTPYAVHAALRPVQLLAGRARSGRSRSRAAPPDLRGVIHRRTPDRVAAVPGGGRVRRARRRPRPGPREHVRGLRPARVACCARHAPTALDPHPAPAWPTPRPPGLTDPWAATSYDGTVRAMIIGHKEHRLLSLAVPLGVLLAIAVAAAVDDAGPDPPAADLLLVPVPSRPSTVRQRGHDRPPTSCASRRLGSPRRAGRLRCVPLLRTRPGLVDQAGLDADARAVNLAGAFRGHRRRSAASPARRGRCRSWSATTSSPPEHRGRGPTGAACGRAGTPRGRRGGGHAPAYADRCRPRPRRAVGGGLRFRDHRARASVGPWSPSGSVVASSRCSGCPDRGTTSRCQSQAKRPT